MCAVVREKIGKQLQKQHLQTFVMKQIEANQDEDDVSAVKQALSHFDHQYFSKLEQSKNNVEYMKSPFRAWFNGEISFGRSKVDQKGRPSLSFENAESERTKRMKTEHIRASNSGSCLLYAASTGCFR